MMVVQSEFQSFLDLLEKRLLALSPRSELAFGTACCERHFQSYLDFSQEYRWGNPQLLRAIMDNTWAIWEDGQTTTPGGMDEVLAKCMAAIPHSDEFSTPLADSAQNLAIMVAHLVEFLQGNDPRQIVLIACLARDLVDATVQIIEGLRPTDPNFEQKISGHPLMHAEFESQRSNLETLAKMETTSGVLKRAALLR